MLVGRKLLQAKLLDVELSIRGILRGFGLKVGEVSRGRFEARIRPLAEGNTVLKYVPVLEQAFLARKRPVGGSWRMDETYVRVKGAWKYLYRAVDKTGATVDFLLTAKPGS